MALRYINYGIMNLLIIIVTVQINYIFQECCLSVIGQGTIQPFLKYLSGHGFVILTVKHTFYFPFLYEPEVCLHVVSDSSVQSLIFG